MIYDFIEWLKAVVVFCLGKLRQQTDQLNAKIVRDITDFIGAVKRFPKMTAIHLPVGLLAFELLIAMMVADHSIRFAPIVVADYSIDPKPTVAMLFVFLMAALFTQYGIVMEHKLFNEAPPLTMKARYAQDTPEWSELRALASIACNAAGWFIASALIWNLEYRAVVNSHLHFYGFGLGIGGLFVGYMAYVTILPQIRDYTSTPVPVSVI